jgi:hypothetical protein
MQILDPSLEIRVEIFPLDVLNWTLPGHLLGGSRLTER